MAGKPLARQTRSRPSARAGSPNSCPARRASWASIPDDPFANLEGGARYLREQLDRFDGDIEKALAAYNAGPGRVDAARAASRAFAKPRLYVASVMGRLSNHSRSPE